jgi:glutamate synthase (NADPH/NADH) small chain
MGHQPVAIGYLERYVADHADGNQQLEIRNQQSTSAIKIAVVGSGPAGLTFAGDMAKYGYEVTVFEALHEIGGVLKYGIPEYRLPNAIVDKEIDGLRALGVHFVTDTIVGKTVTVDDLQAEGFKAVFVASGAGLPRFMGIPGENLNGVMSSNEYLTRVNLMDATNAATDTPVLYGKNVLVIGGGNTAMDAVRTAKRLGAEHAIIVYRRSEDEMPARREEVEHAKAEGIEFMTLHNPLSYRADENGRVAEATLQVMTLGEPDESGRRSPVPVEGKTVTVPADMVVVAVGVSPNPIIPKSVAGLEVSRKGTIVVDDNMRSSLPILYAGGDIVRGGATVILAMSDGRKAAAAMHEALSRQ